VVISGPRADLLALVRAEVVQHEMQPDRGRVEAADVAAEGEELDTALAPFDVAVEPVGADVIGGDQMPDAVRAIERRADAFGLGSGCPAFAAGLRLQVQRPELVETDHDRLAGLRERVEL